MYRVMIIDDEKTLRNLLKLTIQWGELGLEVVGEAASGIEAINIIDEVKPDIVFVDIRMPFMDGIEFSKLAIKRYPNLIILILTAFDDFQYARECIGIGISEYLLKPISRTEITEALEKAVDKLRKVQLQTMIALKEDENSGGGGMAAIQEYIKKNYMNSGMNLTAISQKFGFNPSYLSRRFKADTGISLIDYLTRCRMEKAMEYAKKQVMMYVAAKEVGIPDPNYFGKCFKKYTGKAYSDYHTE